MEIIPQMRLEAQFDTKADVQLILIFFPQSTECIPVCGDIYRKIRLFRFRYPGIIRVQMFGETDTAEPKDDGSADHFFIGVPESAEKEECMWQSQVIV